VNYSFGRQDSELLAGSRSGIWPLATERKEVALELRTSRILVGDFGLSVKDAGRGHPIVLIHGLACGKRMWFRQMRALQERFRVIAYDQRGHGLSDAPADPTLYSPALLASDLVGVLDALEVERAAIVGFSLGGGPALALAATAPERVSRLILADVGAGADDMWRSQWLTQRWTDLIDRGATDDLVCDMLRSEFFKRFAAQSVRSRDYMAGLIRATPLLGLRNILSEVLAKRKSLFRMTTVLKSLKVPTLILIGQHDNVCRAPARLLSSTIPNASIERIPNAGHMAPLENAPMFTFQIQKFMNS
jgi:pimeloyl-ACP methyl ester carboxylesterase